ncbi:MAG TPA: hypothetical protein VK601_01665 [Kofleriaceae bacterium]|nr:hypothetical protein [Kofleriaceae bacterium]
MPRPGGRAVLAVVAISSACRGRAAIGSCDDDLRGVYADGAARWMVLDQGATLEAYPLFPDGDGPPELVTAPRRIELARAASPAPGAAAITGSLRRRYMQRADSCDARVPVAITRCAGDGLELVLADPAPPLGFAPCRWPGPGPSRVARWRRD